MALSQDIKERIFATADALYSASEAGEFPSVEAVRQGSRAGMNNVVEAMKEWRQNQRKQVQAVREPLPLELHEVVLSMGRSLWEAAQQLANESLDASKMAFEMEKNDLIQLSAEQSEAFETQAAELDRAHHRITELERQVEAAKQKNEMAESVLASTRDELLVAKQATELAKQKAEEVERRASELRTELDHAHAEADTLRMEGVKILQRQELSEAERVKLAASLAAAQGEITQVQAALAAAKAVEQAHAEQRKQAAEGAHRAAELMTKAQSERDNARKDAAEARERAAGLAGQLQAMQEQSAALIATLKTKKA